MKKINLDQMSQLDGGMSCGAATAIFVGAFLVCAATTAATWGGAFASFFSLSTAMYSVYDACE